MSRIDFVTGAPEKYAHLVDDLVQVRTELRAVVSSFSEAEMRLGRSDDIWSAKRTLAHIGVYVHVNGVFIHRMITMTDPQRLPVTEDHEIQTRGFMNGSSLELLNYIDQEIQETVGLLAHTPDAAWGRRGVVDGNSRSLRQRVASHADHIRDHADQIATSK
ncbi:MAG TPA: DinB family protein [Dehalococcoidia bacterium]|jgi:hypothetical protein|nr:DinB family protein [Dehalococcoidia bacterium]